MSKDEARQTKLNQLQERHGELTREKQQIQRKTNNRVTEINKELKSLGQAIYDLKNIDGDTPHITDHAVVRYLERVKGVDIWEIKAEIMNYRKSVRVDNVIVTVNPDEEKSCECKEHHYVWHTVNCPLSPGEKVVYED